MKSEFRNLLGFAWGLLRPFRRMAAVAIAMGFVNSGAAVALLAIIDAQLRASAPVAGATMLTYLALLLTMFASEVISSAGNSYVGQDVIAALRRDLTRKIIQAPIDQLEQTQKHQLIAALTEDVDRISGFTRGMSYLIVAICEVAGCALYMIYLSGLMFAAATLVGIATYLGIRHASRLAYDRFAEERNAVDSVQKDYQALIEGAKELRVNRRRRVRFFVDQLGVDIDRIAETTKRACLGFVLGVGMDSASFFIIAGVLIGLSSYLDKAELPKFILILMYLKGPMGQIVLTLPEINLALISFRNVAELSNRLRPSECDLLASPDDERAMGPFEMIELRGVSYRFPPQDGAEPFVLGPIDFRIGAGETIFVVGENGSGKTTFIKTLLGIYAPTSGEVLLNGAHVKDAQRDDYRQYFSAIFFDFYLFDRLIRSDAAATEQVRALLERLDIAHKVTFRDGGFSTLALSAGQRKRLALIESYLEDRPLVVLDEWAAEQDPTFRRIFYREILTEMKKTGKTLIVVSHDDRYFDAADRIVQIKGGKLVERDARLATDPWECSGHSPDAVDSP